MSAEDPPRLLDDPHDALGSLIRSIPDEPPTDEQLAGLAGRLGPLLREPPPGGDGPGQPSAAGPAASPAPPPQAPAALAAKAGGAALAAKWGAVATLAVAGVVAGRSLVTPPPAAVAPPAPSAAASAPVASAPAPLDAPLAPPLPAESATPAPGASAAAAQGSQAAGASAAPADEGPAAEIELLARAQRAVDADAAQALALTAEHRKRFARPRLAQEREMIAITALARLGRAGEARERARRFAASYRGSAHLRRIEALVGPLDGP